MGRRTIESKAPQEPDSPDSPVTPVSPSRRDPIADWLDLFLKMLSLPKPESAAVRDELEDHLRSRVDDLLITGLSEHDAVLQAVGELGETAELARRFKQASHPSRRRQLMSTALIAIAGSALTLGAFTVFNPPTNVSTLTGAAGGAGTVATFVAPPGEAAPFDEKLKKYDIAMFFDPELEGQWGEMHPNQRIESIAETIQNLVSPDSWLDRGGDEASVNVTGNTMFITAPAEIHKGVSWVLDTLIEDLNKEQAAYEKMQAEREAESEERFREHTAQVEERQIEQEKQAEMARADAERQRRHQIEQLRIEYENLKQAYIDVTRTQTMMDLQQQDLEEQWHEAEGDEREIMMMKLAETRARNAETELRYDDTRTRLRRVSSLLMDLELAEYQRPDQPSRAGGATSMFPTDPAEVVQQAALNLARDHMDLTVQVQLATLKQTREIAMQMIQYAIEHGDVLPTRPSQLRELVEADGESWQLFLTPTDQLRAQANNLTEDQAWAWVDEHGSFEILPGNLYEPESVIVRTRQPLPNGQRVAAYGDGHASVVVPEHAAR